MLPSRLIACVVKGRKARDLPLKIGRCGTAGRTGIRTYLRLDRRTAKMPIENRFGSLEPDAFVLAVQQLAQTLDRAGR